MVPGDGSRPRHRVAGREQTVETALEETELGPEVELDPPGGERGIAGLRIRLNTDHLLAAREVVVVPEHDPVGRAVGALDPSVLAGRQHVVLHVRIRERMNIVLNVDAGVVEAVIGDQISGDGSHDLMAEFLHFLQRPSDMPDPDLVQVAVVQAAFRIVLVTTAAAADEHQAVPTADLLNDDLRVLQHPVEVEAQRALTVVPDPGQVVGLACLEFVHHTRAAREVAQPQGRVQGGVRYAFALDSKLHDRPVADLVGRDDAFGVLAHHEQGFDGPRASVRIEAHAVRQQQASGVVEVAVAVGIGERTQVEVVVGGELVAGGGLVPAHRI